MTFGEKVKNERNRLGLNQDELAKKIGVTRRVISSYENDSSRPRGTERYKKLAEALGVNINYLLSEDEAFIADVEDNYGHRGAKQAKELLAEVTGLFAGGEMADETCVKWLMPFRKRTLLLRKTTRNTHRKSIAKTSNLSLCVVRFMGQQMVYKKMDNISVIMALQGR